MTNINFVGGTGKNEDAYIIAYIESCFTSKNCIVKVLSIPEENVMRPDYFIINSGELIEIKEIHDRQQNEQWAAWGNSVEAIKGAIASLGEEGCVRGAYLVNVPEKFSLSRSAKIRIAGARQIVSAINDNQKYVDVYNARFTINKISNDENIIYFSNISQGRSINPVDVVAEGIKSGVAKANQQLNSPPPGITVRSRKVLFINKYIFTLRDWDLFNAIACAYLDIDKTKYIDEIWFQYRDGADDFQHKLIYNRKFFREFNSGDIGNWGKAEYELFSNWFTSIFSWDDSYKEKLLTVLKILFKKHKPYKIFKSAINRAEMIMLGDWLCEKKRYDEVAWLIEQFLDDPNDFTDINGKNVLDDLAGDIMVGKEVTNICSILGRLAWLVNSLNSSKSHINKTADYTIKLLENDNLYVQSIAMLSLQNLISRQELLKAYDRVNGTKYFHRLRGLAFSLMREVGKYPTIANILSAIFCHLLDLTEEETVEVLKKLKLGKYIGRSYVYYAFFRTEQNNKLGKYNSLRANKQLMSVIKGNSKLDNRLAADITWIIWQHLKENSGDFDKFYYILQQIAERPYNRENYSLEHIISDWTERRPEECINLFMKLVDTAIVFMDGDATRKVWVDPKAVLLTAALNIPEKFIKIIDKLMVLWKSGAVIGNPIFVLTSYRYINNEKIKRYAKEKSIEYYGQIKLLQPLVEDVQFPK